MPRTVLSPGNRYHVRGKSKVLFIPRTASGRTPASIPVGPLTLTTALLDHTSTVDLTPAIVPPVSGFTKEQADVPAPDLASLETGTVPGEITYGASSITFYLSEDGADVRAVLHEGDDGYLVLADNGLAVGALVDIAEVTVKSDGKQRDELARVMVPFSVSKLQSNVAVPS